MTTATSMSINGEVAICTRTQRMVSRNSLFAAARNFLISKSSMPKAFTMRFPTMVSCRI